MKKGQSFRPFRQMAKMFLQKNPAVDYLVMNSILHTNFAKVLKNKVVALTMRSVIWNQFPIKILLIGLNSPSVWRLVTWIQICESLNSSQKDGNRAHSADSLKAHSKLRAFIRKFRTEQFYMPEINFWGCSKNRFLASL